jgi:hypothetical protein
MSGWLTNGVTAASLPLTGLETFSADTQLTQGAQPETVAVSTGQLASMMGGQLPMAPNRFYGVPYGNTPGTLLTVTGTLYAYPFYIAAPTLIETIGIYSGTGQTGGALRAGIYADNGAGYPGSLVSGTDGGALAATANTTVSTNTINVTLQSGWYWLATIATASGTFPTVGAITAVYPSATNSQLGSDTAAHLIAASGQAATGISVAATYGALNGISSGTFPTGATLTLNAATPVVILGT